MSPSQDIAGVDRGYIIPIGGAEEKLNNTEILDRFIDICGGRESRIGIIPTASELPDTGSNYEKLFRKIGVKHAKVLPFITREDCQTGSDLKYIEECDGVFMTGGNQLRLSTTLGGTAVARLIRRRNARGMHVAGTSAGAAFMPEHMIAGGMEGSTPSPDMVTMAPGLGLTNRFIIDQHFRQRDRLGRLLTALAFNPFAVGIGLDEDTAAFIGPDETLEVEGTGGVTVVDASKVSFSSVDSVTEGQPICILGLVVHVLTAGATFNLQTRQTAMGSLAQSRA